MESNGIQEVRSMRAFYFEGLATEVLKYFSHIILTANVHIDEYIISRIECESYVLLARGNKQKYSPDSSQTANITETIYRTKNHKIPLEDLSDEDADGRTGSGMDSGTDRGRLCPMGARGGMLGWASCLRAAVRPST